MKLRAFLIGGICLGFATLFAQWSEAGSIRAEFSNADGADAFLAAAAARGQGQGAQVTHNEDGTTSVTLPEVATEQMSETAMDAIAEHANAVEIAPECPEACTNGFLVFANHVATSPEPHAIQQFICEYDPDQDAGDVLLALAAEAGCTGGGHCDGLLVADGACAVVIDFVQEVVVELDDATQRVCAPLAAQVVEDVTDQTCDLSP